MWASNGDSFHSVINRSILFSTKIGLMFSSQACRSTAMVWIERQKFAGKSKKVIMLRILWWHFQGNVCSVWNNRCHCQITWSHFRGKVCLRRQQRWHGFSGNSMKRNQMMRCCLRRVRQAGLAGWTLCRRSWLWQGNVWGPQQSPQDLSLFVVVISKAFTHLWTHSFHHINQH